jgi:hypothetical protein
MAGFTSQRLVLVKAVVRGDDFHLGTGYIVTADLVLTASHVVPEQELTSLEVRTELDGKWRAAELHPIWRDTALDAMLLRIHSPLADTPEIAWVETEFDDDAVWQSSGYPDAGKVDQNGKPAWKTVGLSGKLQAHGGGGQGAKELELTVDAPPPAEQWAGISGAPVFVGERLAGMIKEAPKSFDGGRLAGVPAAALLQNHGFRLALSPRWLDPLPQGIWVLAVISESKKHNSKLAEWVDGALTRDAKALKSVLGAGLQPKALRVRITDALESPGKWLRFVNALCAAPIAIFDATGFEPAVMLALGVRAVVRRGVTLTSTAELLTLAQLSQLPFNIQETKLIYHGSGYAPSDVKHPLIMIAAAIKKGWQEFDSQPNYLDLPAYDAVRCPYPTADADGKSAIKRLLVLCSFGEDHEPNWLHVASALVAHYPDKEAARMLDVASPRLVGQALYEGIRWAHTCVVDWTGWRANVFFELGVRMACSDVGPVSLIAHGAVGATAAPDALVQKRLMMALFGPTAYRAASDDDAIEGALLVHDAIVEQRPPARAVSQLPHDATFRTCRDRFEWKHEHITIEPHELLRSSVEAPFGKDPQAGGRSPLLFSANPDYSKELDRSVKERWIAAWYYLSQRNPKARWSEDRGFRAALRKLGNDVLLFGLPAPNEAHLIALRDQIYDVIDELDELDDPNQQQTMQGPAHARAD